MSTGTTMYCGECGVPVASTARFCSTCGSAQFEDDVRALAEQADLRERGVLRSFLDIRFNFLVTPRIIGFFYALLLVIVAVAYPVSVAGAFQQDSTTGALVLFLGPLIGLLYVLFVRVFLEFLVAPIKVAEHTAKTVALLARQRTP